MTHENFSFDSNIADIICLRDVDHTKLQELSTVSKMNQNMVVATKNTLDYLQSIHRTTVALDPLIPLIAGLATQPRLSKCLRINNSDYNGSIASQPAIRIQSGSGTSPVVSNSCLCRPKTGRKMTQRRIGPIIFVSGSSSSTRHVKDCPYYYDPTKSRKYGVKIMLGQCVRKWEATAMLNYNSSAGVFSIGPTLAFKAIVDAATSPAFRAVEGILHSHLEGDRIDDSVYETTLQDLLQMFTEGRASPTDTCQDGSTLVHVGHSQENIFMSLIDILQRVLEFPTSTLYDFFELESRVESFRKLLFGLISVGVPFNDADIQGK